MSMDRRSFIKLTAVTGGATAIAACSTSSPENQLIRFVPDEDLTPGIAGSSTACVRSAVPDAVRPCA
jgi:hypothetical protein